MNETNDTQFPYLQAETRIELPKKSIYCSCVLYARYYSGRLIYGNANTQKPTKFSNPQVNDWVLFGNHVAVVVKVDGETLTIIEANYSSCRVTNRTINVNDKSIVGFK